MPKTYVNDGGTWRDIHAIYANDSGTWRPIRRVYANDGGTWRLVFGTTQASQVFSVGTTNWTVPDGVYEITATGCGGGGGGGGSDAGANYNGNGGAGGGANLVSQTVSVVPGETLTIVVGAGGAGGGTYNPGQPGVATTITRVSAIYTAAGGGQGQGYVAGSSANAYAGLGVNGANYPTPGPTVSGITYSNQRTTGRGTSTNGGSNGGAGGIRSGGATGQNGKLTITW
jgi:hypothetical protein